MQSSTPSTPSTPSSSNPSWTYSGCAVDTVNPRTLPNWSNFNGPNMSNAACISFCDGAGFSLAGTEYAGQCFCGNDITTTPLDESQCNMPCAGAAGEMCGGPGALSLWKKSAVTEARAMMAKRQLGSLGRYARVLLDF